MSQSVPYPEAKDKPVPTIRANGSSLSEIAARYDVSVDELRTANCMNDDESKSDNYKPLSHKNIYIPDLRYVKKMGLPYHVVKAGDSLWGISKKYAVDLKALKTANPKVGVGALLLPGEVLVLPS